MDFQIDETTWHDLDMDEVLKKLDICTSSVGHEYVKSSLKDLSFSEDVLKGRSERADYLSSDDTLSAHLRKIFTGLGVTKKVSFRDHIFKLNEVKKQSNIKHYILAILLIAAIAMLFIRPVIGIIGIVVMFTVNISLYFADKSKIEAYFICLKYLAAMVVSARKIASCALTDTPFEGYMHDLKRLEKTFAPIKRGSWLITNSVSGSLVDVIMDYIRMLFHVDLIKFNQMRKTAMDHAAEIDELYSILGEIELALCISQFRKNNAYAEPDFLIADNSVLSGKHVDSGCDLPYNSVISSDNISVSNAEPNAIDDIKQNHKAEISFENIRHPLISDPVGNSLKPEHAVLLTGSNASGKSTFLKSIAINQIFAQTIYTCLADSFTTSFCKVISSMALSDNILGNESYFVVEVKSLKRIFDELGDIPVMCFVDEVLRGTNTKERIAASTVILKDLAQKNTIVFAATHDIELTQLLETCMSNYHFSETVTDTVSFDYKLKDGPSTSRNAIRLLDMYGFDKDIVHEAEAIAAE